MEKDELFKLVAVLTAKNTALEEEIKRLNKQTDRLWEDLKEYEKDQDDVDYLDDDDYLDDSQYPSMEDEIEREEELSERTKINSIDAKLNVFFARLNGNSSKLKELVEKVDELDGYYRACLKYLIDDDKQFNPK